VKHLILFVLLSASVAPACSRVGAPADEQDAGPLPPFGSDELIHCVDLPYQPNGQYDIESVELDGDDLVIEVGYGGGCVEHEWMLCFPGIILASLPGRIPLALLHEDNGDTCEADFHETLRFDVSPLPELAESPSSMYLCPVACPEDCDLIKLSSECCASPETLEDALCVLYEP